MGQQQLPRGELEGPQLGHQRLRFAVSGERIGVDRDEHLRCVVAVDDDRAGGFYASRADFSGCSSDAAASALESAKRGFGACAQGFDARSGLLPNTCADLADKHLGRSVAGAVRVEFGPGTGAIAGGVWAGWRPLVEP